MRRLSAEQHDEGVAEARRPGKERVPAAASAGETLIPAQAWTLTLSSGLVHRVKLACWLVHCGLGA